LTSSGDFPVTIEVHFVAVLLEEGLPDEEDGWPVILLLGLVLTPSNTRSSKEKAYKGTRMSRCNHFTACMNSASMAVLTFQDSRFKHRYKYLKRIVIHKIFWKHFFLIELVIMHSEVFSPYIFYWVCKLCSCFSFSTFGVHLLKMHGVLLLSQNFEPKIVGPKVFTHFTIRHLLFCFSFASGVGKPRTPNSDLPGPTAW